MPSTCMMSASNLPPPLPARGNLPPLRNRTQINRTASAVGRPLPAPPKDDSTTRNNAQTLPGRKKNSPVVNYENHEIGMSKIKSLPAQLSQMAVDDTPPPPPPSRPPKRPSMPNIAVRSPTSPAPPPRVGQDLPPTVPRRRPSTSASPASPRNDTSSDLESRFLFHDASDFPPPETFAGDPKSYASKSGTGKHKGSRRRKTSSQEPPM